MLTQRNRNSNEFGYVSCCMLTMLVEGELPLLPKS